ncbi:hypothetical protein RCL_jg1062.t1 [Rhizophagus clarus]|uniref:Uncharacterized protein n=1 Tax=Rhizophagus clarus TaxID=94130 RepID=A0A8H3R1M9_9GLOM|nr:hypothetical protein RCL_jg1062.t1 [Rhizophagus clarus]
MEYLNYNEKEELLLEENLNKFLAEILSESNVNINTHKLMWMEDYESDLITFISSFSSTMLLEIQKRFPD